MPSLDFEQEKRAFRKFYDSNRPLLEKGLKAYISIIRSLLKQHDIGEVTKIEGRVKEKDVITSYSIHYTKLYDPVSEWLGHKRCWSAYFPSFQNNGKS